jgi:hypothetical protein
VAAAVGQGFPPVQSPASNRTYQPLERVQGRGGSQESHGGVAPLDLTMEVRRGDLHAASPSAAAMPPTRPWRSPCSTSSHRPPPGRRCSLRMRPPPQIPSSPPTRMERRQPGRHLPRRPRGLSRRLPPAAARQGKGRGEGWRRG